MPTTETSGILAGGIYQFVNTSTGTALSYDGSAFSMQPSDPTVKAQRFKLYYIRSGMYRIVPLTARGKRIRVGAPIVAGNQAASYVDEWYLVKYGSSYKIYSASNSTLLLSYDTARQMVLTRNSTVRSYWTLNLLGLDVPLLQQQASNTCSAASALMILHFHGYTSISESDFIQAAGGVNGNFNVVINMTNALNSLLAQNGNNTTYSWLNINSYSAAQFKQIINDNIANSNPVIIDIRSDSSTGYFPYNTNGHYVVVTGIYHDSTTDQDMIIINDPHYNYCCERIIPLSSLWPYITAGNEHIIRVN